MKEKPTMNELFATRIIAVLAFCTLVLGMHAQNHVRNGGFDELRPGSGCYQPLFTPLQNYLAAWYTQSNTPERISECGELSWHFPPGGPTVLPKTLPNFIHFINFATIYFSDSLNPPRVDTTYYIEAIGQKLLATTANSLYRFSFWGNVNTPALGPKCKPKIIEFFLCEDSIPVEKRVLGFNYIKVNEGNRCLQLVFEVQDRFTWDYYEQTIRPSFPLNYLVVGFGEHSNPFEDKGVYCQPDDPNSSYLSAALGLDDLKLVPISINPVFPNTFTPNGDGSNDALVIKDLPEGSSFEVYNRWGIKVFAQDNYTQDWKGQSDQGQDLPEGVYYMVVRYLDGVGETQVVRKTVHLFR
jgi:gliding motility-associated-like protein